MSVKPPGLGGLFYCGETEGQPMLLLQSRVFAATKAEAIKKIQAKHGTGEIRIYQAPVQPRRGLIWWEYNIEVT